MTNLCSALMVCALAVGMFPSTPSAEAQTGTTAATVNVPFDFQINKYKMPAGVYRIDREEGSMVVLRGASDSGMVLTRPTSPRKVSARGFVAFHRIGSTYFLGELRFAGESSVMECFESPAEKEMLKSTKEALGYSTIAVSSHPRL